jgi:type VI secretion system secreted protein Hcp
MTMAMDMFMKLDKIDGESKDHKHKGSIDVLAWSWGVSNSGSAHTGGGGGAGKANFQDLSFTKWMDKGTTELLIAASNGKKPLEYLKITMEECLVTSVSTGGSGGEDRLTENVTLNFAKVKVEYAEQKPDGSGHPAKEFKWNIEANSAD